MTKGKNMLKKMKDAALSKYAKVAINKQIWDIYSHITSEGLGRKAALAYSKGEKGTVVRECFVKLESDHKINVVINARRFR